MKLISFQLNFKFWNKKKKKKNRRRVYDNEKLGERGWGRGGAQGECYSFFLNYTCGHIRDSKYPKIMKQCCCNALIHSTLDWQLTFFLVCLFCHVYYVQKVHWVSELITTVWFSSNYHCNCRFCFQVVGSVPILWQVFKLCF